MDVISTVLHLPYEKMAAAAHNPIGKLVLLGIVALPAWHAAHRLRMTAHDLGLGSGFANQDSLLRLGSLGDRGSRGGTIGGLIDGLHSRWSGIVFAVLIDINRHSQETFTVHCSVEVAPRF